MNKTDKAENAVIETTNQLVKDGGYTLRDDVITDLGKFEGEHIMTLYFYDAFMNGDGESSSQYFPNVWLISDHGNALLITI